MTYCLKLLTCTELWSAFIYLKQEHVYHFPTMNWFMRSGQLQKCTGSMEQQWQQYCVKQQRPTDPKETKYKTYDEDLFQ